MMRTSRTLYPTETPLDGHEPMTIRYRHRAIYAFATCVCACVLAWGVAGAKNPSNMSIEDMVGNAGSMVDSMGKDLSNSFKLLEESISGQNVGATVARNEAITAMKGLVKLSEENFVSLQQAAAEGDRESVEREFVKIMIAQNKIGELFAQVKTAGGIMVDMETPDTERTVEIDSEMLVVLVESPPAPPVVELPDEIIPTVSPFF
jgi:hypothetical protein